MPTLPLLIEAMGQPGFFPDSAVPVELRQTHISYVFLVGEFVYKVKKPVRFTFLDYSTLEQRHHFCQEEVRLNRRLAPTVYLGVVPILKGHGGFVLGNGIAEPETRTVAEYAVKMRRLPEDRMLDALVKACKIGVSEIEAIARKLVSFHLAASADRAPIYGAPDSIWQKLSDNFTETEPFIGKTISQSKFTSIQDFSVASMNERRTLFEIRIHEKRIREGHGDLRAEHICLTEPIAVFDCIEFSESLRYCDVASEIAFLAMDLDFLGAHELSERLVTTYATTAQDKTFLTLIPFYKCYRAFVRGKVESLKSREKEVSELERERAAAQAKRYFRLSYRYAKGAPPPSLLIVCGLAGTGKSTITRILRDLTGFEVLNSDAVRKRIRGISTTARISHDDRSNLYSDSFTQLTYGTLLAEAERSLRAGRGMIVDATFKDPEHRRLFLESAQRMGVPVLFVECQAHKQEVLRRLRRRVIQADEVSDATVKVYLQQWGEFVPLSEIADHCHIRFDTERDWENELKRVEDFLYNQSTCS